MALTSLALTGVFHRLRSRLPRWNVLTNAQKVALVSFISLTVMLPIITLATLTETRLGSRAVEPVTPPITPPNTPTPTPVPPSTKIISFENATTVFDPKYVAVKQRIVNPYKTSIEITKIGLRINPVPGASYKFSVWSDNNGKVGNILGEKIIKNTQPAGQDWVYATFDQPIITSDPYLFVGVERAYVYFTLILSVGNDGNENTYISDGNFAIQKPYDLLYQVFGRVSPSPTSTPSPTPRLTTTPTPTPSPSPSPTPTPKPMPTLTPTPTPTETPLVSQETSKLWIGDRIRQRVYNPFDKTSINKIGLFLLGGEGSTNQISVWADNNGSLGNKLGSSIEFTVTGRSEQWYEIGFPLPVEVTNKYFFIGVEKLGGIDASVLNTRVGSDGKPETYLVLSSGQRVPAYDEYDAMFRVYGEGSMIRPTPTPTPTPQPNIAPRIQTWFLKPGRINRNYRANVVGTDRNQNDNLTLTTARLPAGIIQGPCSTVIQNKNVRISCVLSGRPTAAGVYPVHVVLTDNHGGKTENDIFIIIYNFFGLF